MAYQSQKKGKSMAIITAKYRSQCSICGEMITAGSKIEYTKGQPTHHATCQPVALPADAIHLSIGQGYAAPSFSGWTPGAVIVNPRYGRTELRYQRLCTVCGQDIGRSYPLVCDACKAPAEEHRTEVPIDTPQFLVVLTANRRFYRDDGMSFGVGDEQGYVYSAACRPATDEEAQPLREQMAAAAQQRQAAADLKTLYAQIVQEGEYPEGSHSLEGEQVDIKPQTLYGGGEWFVLGPEWIWAVRNNGADGDNWSGNNVKTGGAGAIGRRVPATAELAERIRTLYAGTAEGQRAQEQHAAASRSAEAKHQEANTLGLSVEQVRQIKNFWLRAAGGAFTLRQGVTEAGRTLAFALYLKGNGHFSGDGISTETYREHQEAIDRLREEVRHG